LGEKMLTRFANNEEEMNNIIMTYLQQNYYVRRIVTGKEMKSPYLDPRDEPEWKYQIDFSSTINKWTPTSNIGKVKQFHKSFGLEIGDVENPKKDDGLRLSLITEEYKELVEAMELGDMVNIAKELTDLLYVVYGTGITMGINLDLTMELVHNSNMSKLDENGKPVLRDDGKILKGTNYVPADLSEIINGPKSRKTSGNKS